MYDNLALQRARGAEEEILPQHVSIAELTALTEAVARMGEAQQRSQQILIESITGIADAIRDKDFKQTDIAPVLEALVTLKGQVMAQPQVSAEADLNEEWTVDFDRGANQLIKSGFKIRRTA